MKKELTGYPSIDKTHLEGTTFFERNPIIPNVSLYNTLNLMEIFYKDINAVECLGVELTFGELMSMAVKISKAFKELGVNPSQIITVSMPNFYQALAIYLAANRVGATVTFLNSASSLEEVCHYIDEFDSPIYLNYDKSNEYNEQIKKKTNVHQIITLDDKSVKLKEFSTNQKELGYSDLISFNDLEILGNYYKKHIRTNFGGKQDSLILFTSGTTGNPKPVLLTNRNILASGIYMKNSTHISNVKGEKSLVCVPFCYPYGFATSTLMSLLCGREAILAPSLSSKNISFYLDKQPNVVFGSPALLELIKRNVHNGQDLSSIHTFISGGDFLNASQSRDAKKFFLDHNSNVAICNGSGNAETVGANTNAVGNTIKPNTVGKILLGSTALIVNPDNLEEMHYNEEGLLLISGKHVFKSYYNNPILTEKSKVIINGKTYFKTGTIGKLDKEGYFTLTGRDSRYYIISTLNKVYCDRIQTIMSEIDIIDSIAVVKQFDEEMLYSGKAYIVLKKGICPTEEMKQLILNICKKEIYIKHDSSYAQLKDYEIPKSIEFVDELPKTLADKIDYKKLEKMAQEELDENSGIKLKMSK